MKLMHFFVSAIMILTFAGIMNAQAVQSGKFEASSSTSDYTLDKGTGDRSYTIQVKFNTPFASKPDIIVSPGQIDANTKETNLRYKISYNGVNANGFSIVVNTWNDTKLFSVGGSWIAVGAGADAPKMAKKKK